MDPPLFNDMRATEKAVVVGMRVGSSDDVGSANRVKTAVGSRYLVEGERKGNGKADKKEERQDKDRGEPFVHKKGFMSQVSL